MNLKMSIGHLQFGSEGEKKELLQCKKRDLTLPRKFSKFFANKMVWELMKKSSLTTY